MVTVPERATTVDDILRTCDPERPLESKDPRYEDLSPGRGDNTLRSLKKLLITRPEGTWLHAAFLSHRGAGKTTELKRLMADLQHNFDSYYIEANLQLDPRHLTTEDLLLTLSLGVQDYFTETGRGLPEKRVKKVSDWFSDVLKTTEWAKKLSADLSTTAGAGLDVPLIVLLKAELKALLRNESEYRTQVRDAIRRQPNALIEAVNSVMRAAQERLDAEGKGRQLLVVIDNLDRYDPKIVDDLLIQRGLLRDVQCHMLVTPPISLHYKPIGEPLSARYACQVMNTVKLREAGQDYREFAADRQGFHLLLAALDRRLDVAKLIPDTAAQERLVAASGGAIRNLLQLTQEAALVATVNALDLPSVDAAARRMRAGMRDRINANGWATTLAKLAVTKQPHEDPNCMTVLFQQLALKYNGETWYDVHPLVAEIPEVIEAIATQREARARRAVPGEDGRDREA